MLKPYMVVDISTYETDGEKWIRNSFNLPKDAISEAKRLSKKNMGQTYEVCTFFKHDEFIYPEEIKK